MTFYGKGIFAWVDVQRRGIKLVSEIGVFLVVRFAIDVDLVEKIERRSDTGDRLRRARVFIFGIPGRWLLS